MNSINAKNLDSKIIDSVMGMDVIQKQDVLDYVGRINLNAVSKEKYRRDAMRQIRAALANSF